MISLTFIPQLLEALHRGNEQSCVYLGQSYCQHLREKMFRLDRLYTRWVECGLNGSLYWSTGCQGVQLTILRLICSFGGEYRPFLDIYLLDYRSFMFKIKPLLT